MKNVAILFANNVEGTGITTCVTELLKNIPPGFKCKVYVAFDKNYGRHNYWFKDKEIRFKLVDKFQCQNISNEIINWANGVCMVASPKRGFGPNIMTAMTNLKNMFWKFRENKIKITAVNFNLQPPSLNTTFSIFELYNLCDGIFTYNPYKDTLSKFLQVAYPDMPIYKKPFALTFNDHTERFNKPFEKRIFDISYFGRYSTWKDPVRLVRMAPALRTVGITPNLVGIEKSVQTAQHLFSEPYAYYTGIKEIALSKTKIDRPEVYSHHIKGKNPDKCCFIYGLYERIAGMDIMSRTKLVVDFFQLQNINNKVDRLENTTHEGVMCGCIPVLDKKTMETIDVGLRHGENCVMVDKNNPEKSIPLIKILCTHPSTWEGFRLSAHHELKSRNNPEREFTRALTDMTLPAFRKVDSSSLDNAIISHCVGRQFEYKQNIYTIEEDDVKKGIDEIHEMQLKFECIPHFTFQNIINIFISKNKYLSFYDDDGKIMAKYNYYKKGDLV